MKKSIAFVLLLALFSCGQEPAPAEQASSDVVRTEKEVAITSGTPVATADLSIDGMTCAMGCGGAIKSALAKLPGVNATTIDFKSADQANHAVVTYDPSKVSDAELVKAVHAIHDGQYKVGAVGVTKELLSSGQVEPPAKGEEEDKVSASLPDVVFPSVVALLSRLLRV